jgi:hypothetical protein
VWGFEKAMVFTPHASAVREHGEKNLLISTESR